MKVAILFFGFFALCMPALGDLAAGKQALQNGDYAAALKEFLPLAEQGDAEAQINLGFMYRDGDGVPQDDKEAVRWFRLAAEQGLANGQFNLGFMYGTGHGVPRDDKEAVRWYRLAAEQGLAPAQSNLGREYQLGRGVPQDDKEAVRWYRLAAEQGLADAQSVLGLAYVAGHGVPQDDKEAVRWYRLAAEQGLALAQYNLGVEYATGQGVPQDDKEAVRWFRLAAEQGVAEAQLNLGLAYLKGQAVPLDYIQACMWFTLAGGDANGIKARDIVVANMTPKQVAEAERLAREWKPKAGTLSGTTADDGALGDVTLDQAKDVPDMQGAQRVPLPEGISQGFLVDRVMPVYPALARTARIQGAVVLTALIGKDGAVQELELVSGHPMLVPAAMEAVKQWRYKPYVLNGEPVLVQTTINVNFALANN
jgi:uncharacterized protein